MALLLSVYLQGVVDGQVARASKPGLTSPRFVIVFGFSLAGQTLFPVWGAAVCVTS